MEPTGGQGWDHRDPYDVLGVCTSASQRDIVRAYHRAARRAHPDARLGDPVAAARFRDLTASYELLSDPGRRADYDRGHLAARPSGPPPGPAAGGAAWYWGGSLYAGTPWHPPIVAGPVHIEPPAAGQHRGSPPASEPPDPVVILGMRVAGAWSWVW